MTTLGSLSTLTCVFKYYTMYFYTRTLRFSGYIIIGLPLQKLRSLWLFSLQLTNASAAVVWKDSSVELSTPSYFLANVNVLRYVCYMLSAVRLSSVCRLSATLVHFTQAVELFGNFFSPYNSPGTLLFWCQKSLVGDAPFPLKFAFKVTHPLSNS